MSKLEPAAVGIDGCNGGWVVACLGADGTPFGRDVRHHPLFVIRHIGELKSALAARGMRARRAFIDIPIGLADRGPRPVDVQAARALGARASSVFAIPPRQVLEAASHAEAVEQSRALMGRGISIQCWNLLPKVREVDAWLRDRPPGHPDLVESHPELAFARLSPADLGRKSTPAGVQARCALLRRLGVNVKPLLKRGPERERGVRAARHDVLDALVLAWCASLPAAAMQNLPVRFRRDAHGLPMRMRLPRGRESE